MQAAFTKCSPATQDALMLQDGKAQHYWREVDPKIAQVVALMDDRETWTLEDSEIIRERMDQLVARLKVDPSAGQFALKHPEKAVELMGWLKTSASMMLLHYTHIDRQHLIEHFIGACNALLHNAETEQQVRAATLAIDRFMVFERLAMLRQLFDQSRVESVKEAIRKSIEVETKGLDANAHKEGIHE